MNQLIEIKNKEGQLVVSSRQIARDFGKEHRVVLKAIDDLINEMGVAQNYAGLFIPNEYTHEQNKQTYREYLITRDGFSLLVMGFTGNKALEWKLKYIEAFNKMEETLQTGILDNLSTEMQALIMHDKKIQAVVEHIETHDKKIKTLENTMTIDYGQQRTLEKLVGNTVLTALGGKGRAYQKIGKKVFAECNRDIKDRFNVNSRCNIPKVKFDEACEYIKNWQPCTNTKALIKDCSAAKPFEFWVNFLEGRFAVHCGTEEKAKAFLMECSERGLTWQMGTNPTKYTFFETNGRNTCYRYYGKKIEHGSVDYFKSIDYKIVEY